MNNVSILDYSLHFVCPNVISINYFPKIFLGFLRFTIPILSSLFLSFMASFGKRMSSDATNGNGGFAGSKRVKGTETDSKSGLGSKSKPCTKFFSTSGCPFGDGCHFLHYVPGGYSAVSQQLSNAGNHMQALPSRGPMGPSPVSDSHGGGPPAVKTKLCKRFASPEGCKFGNKCNFAHGEHELGNPLNPFHDMPANDYDSRMGPPPSSNFGGRPGYPYHEPNPSGFLGQRMGGPPAPSSFGASATAKISVDSSLSGAIIGKGGVNTKHICRVTGAKVAIRDHESDSNLKNIELEGTFDQINQASAMVQELIMTIRSGPTAQMPPMKNAGYSHAPPAAAAGGGGQGRPNFRAKLKTKLCDNFNKGTCTFGDQCSFAHGESELRQSAM